MYRHRMRRQPKVALYSHDTQGLGHVRRNLAIATALLRSHVASEILLISGTDMTSELQLPSFVSFITLPGIAKDKSGRYHARSGAMPLEALLERRSRLIINAVRNFTPDLFIVDKVPYGVQDELAPALSMLKANGNTKLVLGLRDILDDAVTTRQDWQKNRGEEAVRALYDAVWVYGDPNVFDTVYEYELGETVATKATYTGYLNRLSPDLLSTLRDHPQSDCESLHFPSRRASARNSWQGALRSSPISRRTTSEANPSLSWAVAPHHQLSAASQMSIGNDGRLALCQVGGGQDGFEIAHAFARANLPTDMRGLILTGPFMPDSQRSTLYGLVAQRPDLSICEFTPQPEKLLQQADCVVTMGGYNSTCELLAMGKRALMSPRTQPRLEQWIRGQRLAQLGLIDLVHPDHLSPSKISNWLARDTGQIRMPRQTVDLNGLLRIPMLVREMFGSPKHQQLVFKVPFASDTKPILPNRYTQSFEPHYA